MRQPALALAAAAFFLAASGAAPAAQRDHNQPVYRVDSVSAHVTRRKLTISAKGAVKSGGWENPHLHVLHQTGSEPDTLQVEFLASPPAKTSAVIQALLPVSATITVALPRYATTKVTVKAETNSVTADIQAAK